MNRKILALAVPSIITNLTTPLLGLMDVGFVGHMGSPVYIAAIAAGGTVFNMIYWLFGFLRMGSSGLTAQAFGAGDRRGELCVFWRAMTLALQAGLLLILLSFPAGRLIMRFLEIDAETSALALRYFSILIWGAPAVLATYAMTGWFLGMQNARAPMWISILINVANIAVSMWLVAGVGMKIEGVAIGTLTAQWLGFVAGMIVFWCKYRLPLPSLVEITDSSGLRRFFSVNTDIFLRTLCLVAVTVWFTRAGAMQGTDMLAVNTLLMQFFMIFSFFMDGFAFSGEALVGRYTGAADLPMLHRCIKALFMWSGGIAAVFALVYWLGGSVLLSLLSGDTQIQSIALGYLHWAVLIPALSFPAFCWDGIYIGATDTRAMLAAMAGAMAVFFILYFLLSPHCGNNGLWIAFLSYLTVRGLVLTLCSRRIYRGYRR